MVDDNDSDLEENIVDMDRWLERRYDKKDRNIERIHKNDGEIKFYEHGISNR